MHNAHCDFESRSELDLREVGLWNYVRHPSTDVWCMAWAIGENEPQVYVPDAHECPVRDHVVSGGHVYAHNAPFELAVWNEIMVKRHGWPALKPEQTFCTMSMCYAMGLPGALEDAGLALALEIQKDREGRALMLKMADRTRYPTAKPEDLKRLYTYCQQDVRVERALHHRLMPLSERERKVWLLDYKTNQRGVQIDVESAKAAIKLAETVKGQAGEKLSQITGGKVQAVTALPALKDWLAGQGCSEAADGLAKQDVADILDGTSINDSVRAALIVRQEAGKASTAKFDVMVRQAGTDGRLRNMYQYHGAQTGRWAGRAVQAHNLPRDMPKPEIVERILELVGKGDHDAIDMIYGPPLTVVSKCLRSFFVAPPGKMLISGDWANVEGRGQAWFAGEEWKLQAFRAADAKTGPGIYELAYSRMFNVPVESVQNPSEERQVGKVAELAFGYQGGVGSFHSMGKNYGVKVSDARANEFKEAWRAAHPRIKGVWYGIQDAALAAVRNPGEKFSCGYPGRQAVYRVVGSFLWCLLPSGRAICYPYPKILDGEYGPMLTYMSRPGQDKKDVIYDPANSNNWARVSTYGGALFNNIVQGTARDMLAETMLRLDAADAKIVIHTHDECVIEVDEIKTENARVAMQKFMLAAPVWAKDFPFHVECVAAKRYGQ